MADALPVRSRVVVGDSGFLVEDVYVDVFSVNEAITMLDDVPLESPNGTLSRNNHFCGIYAAVKRHCLPASRTGKM